MYLLMYQRVYTWYLQNIQQHVSPAVLLLTPRSTTCRSAHTSNDGLPRLLDEQQTEVKQQLGSSCNIQCERVLSAAGLLLRGCDYKTIMYTHATRERRKNRCKRPPDGLGLIAVVVAIILIAVVAETMVDSRLPARRGSRVARRTSAGVVASAAFVLAVVAGGGGGGILSTVAAEGAAFRCETEEDLDGSACRVDMLPDSALADMVYER